MRADHQRLRRARQPGDEAVAADEQRDEDLLEHVLLADDDLVHLREDVVSHRVKVFDALFQFGGVERGFSSRCSHRWSCRSSWVHRGGRGVASSICRSSF